jgi:chromosomal replication initiator protein
LRVGVPNPFVKQQLESKFNQQITEVLQKNGIEVKQVDYVVSSARPKAKESLADIVVSRPSQNQASQSAPRTSNQLVLNKKYTYDSFIVGSSNELAYTACLAIAREPGTKYNPLFIYGGVGLGKTHLIQAAGNEVVKQNPKARVVYVSSETFVSEFLHAIQYKKKGAFTERYRTADVLIIDDIQFIAGKEKTQEEFFHTFNALHQANKQVILSSDKPPKSIQGLEDRLRSRFEWGMAVDIQPPDFETRAAIVQAKAETSTIQVPSEVVEYLATHVQTNIRELEGALNQLVAFCEMRGINPDIGVAESLLSSSRVRPKHISARLVVERTARHFQVDLDEMLGPKRDKDIVVPRQIAMFLLRSELHLSFPKIARELGRKDHTTAIHSVDKIQSALNLDQVIRQHVNQIKERLYA